MPVKKTRKAASKKPVQKPIHIEMRPKTDKQMGLAFITFLLFISLAVISFALYRVYNEQTRLLGVINSLSNEVSEQQVVILPDNKDKIEIQYKESEVVDLSIGYTPCPATFTGPCDDLMIYRVNDNGSKEVLIPSVRALSSAPLTTELLQPIAINTDESRIALGAWAYGGKRNNNDKRVWIVDIASGKVTYQSSIVPKDAIYSPNMAYATYYVEDEAGEEKVMVINIEDDEKYLAARASNGITYKDANSKATINWLDDSTLAIVQYELDEDGGASTIIGEREITIN
jgi:hypothetical protein